MVITSRAAIEKPYQKNKHELITVGFSLIPVLTALFLYLTLNALIFKLDLNINYFLYLFLIASILFLSNLISFISLFSLIRLAVYWRSCLLLNVFFIGIVLASSSLCSSFGYYLMCLSFFHLSEFLFTSLFNHNELNTDSFLLNHSIEYITAAVSSWLEYFLELYFLPQLKSSGYFHLLGLSLILFGEIFRKLAMYTAGTNFNHIVQERKQANHKLVTNGVYKLVRHPSYFGWFYWSIGTQVLLANPICIVLYALASWKFFYGRIIHEEFCLIKFFGQDYLNYQKKVSSGIPFIKGYCTDDKHDDQLD